MRAGIVACVILLTGLYAAADDLLANPQFKLRFGPQGISSLKHTDDAFDTDYIRQGGSIGRLVVAYRQPGEPWTESSTDRATTQPSRAELGGTQRYAWRFDDQLELSERFAPEGDSLLWTIELRNCSGQKPLEIGDLALPMAFNTNYVWDKQVTYTQRLIPHFLIAGDGSFIFLMRTNGVEPYLVMTPGDGTHLEFLDQAPSGARRERLYCAYIHSALSGPREAQKGGTWRQPHSSATLAPAGQKGDRATYTFRFNWAKGYQGVRDTLYREGLVDVNVAPGMTVPRNLQALVSLRTRNRISAVQAEFPDQTQVEDLGQRGEETRLYRVTFSKLGENLLTVRWGDGRRMSLEFFVTEPLETLIRKRAAFLISHQQHRDSSKWFDGLISDWDMRNKKLRSPDDTDGLNPYVVACDDPGLCKAPYVASKNVEYPDAKEIEALDYYIAHYVWGGLQQTEKEKYPYGIYGIPNWKVLRDSPDPGRAGREHLWRIYDYPHIVLLYYRMYQVALFHPQIPMAMTKDQYLRRAYGTAKAFFTVPMTIEKWSAYETGTYNELVIAELIESLEQEGWKKEADDLRGEWERKVRHFVNEDPYLFGSEFPFDSTGFESTHAFARYALQHAARPGTAAATPFQQKVKYEDAERFMEKQIRCNLACRGWLETAYYYLGSDYRAGLGGSYTLSYMAQMGGWGVLDYGLNYAKDAAPYLRLGYASYLSSWALMNTGTAESNYGYWYPGPENDGAAGGGFEPRSYARCWLGKWTPRGSWFYGCEIDLGFSGALRTAATVVADDPLFGRIAYGGVLKETEGRIEVIPRDGLRKRLHVRTAGQRVSMVWDHDGFASEKPIVLDAAGKTIRFSVENRDGVAHQTTARLSGLPAGCSVEGAGAKLDALAGGEARLTLALPKEGAEVTIHLP